MMVTDVGYLMYYVFLLMELFGLLVLLYHMTSYYSLRGGRSISGADCGVFYVHANASAVTTNWSFCAALDCFILCSSWWLL